MRLGLGLHVGKGRAGAGGGGGGAPSTGTELLVMEADGITTLSDGDPVVTWPNAAGDASDGTKNGGTVTWHEDVVNGHPAVKFNTGWVDVDLGALPADFVRYLVMRHNESTGGTRYFLGTDSTALTAHRNEFLNAAALRIVFDNSGFFCGANSLLLTTFHLVKIKRFNTGGVGIIEIDGVETRNATFGASTYGKLRIGNNGAESAGANMDLAAIVDLEGPAPEDETTWESYLTGKYLPE